MKRPIGQDALDAALGAAVRSVGRLFAAERPRPRPVALAMLVPSILGIALAACALVALVGAVAALILYLRLGRMNFSDLLVELQFNSPLRARLAASAISVIYVAVAVATLAASKLRAGRLPCLALVGAGRGRWRRRDVVPVAAATLAYAAAFTLVQVVGRERRLVLSGPTDFVLLGLLSANLIVLAPLAEELFFRGWVYTSLRARLRFTPAYLITAACFAAIHWDASHRHMLRVLPLALSVGLLRELTGSVRPTIALHAAYNLVIVAITLAAA